MNEHITLDNATLDSLAGHKTIDLTTIGRQSGEPRRIEIWWFRHDDRFIITGTPGKRDWYANVAANPHVTVHTPIGDFKGHATPITDTAQRHAFFSDPTAGWYKNQADINRLVAEAPMIEIEL